MSLASRDIVGVCCFVPFSLLRNSCLQDKMVSHIVQKQRRKPSHVRELGENLPMAKLDDMAKASPMYL